MPSGTRTLLALACAGLGVAGALLGGRNVPLSPRRSAVEPPFPVILPPRPPTWRPEEPTPRDRRFEAQLERLYREREARRREADPIDPRANPPVASAREFVLREYLDLSARVSRYPARVRGALWLAPDGRAFVRLQLGPLLTGAVRAHGRLLEAEGRWRLDGDELVLTGLDLADGDVEVFRPHGATRRWRTERDGGRLVVRADPFTFDGPPAN
jgi:hypothetical protein